MEEEYKGLTLPLVEVVAPKLYSLGYDDNGNPIYTTDYDKSDKGITERLIKEGKYYPKEEADRQKARREIVNRRPGLTSPWVKPIRDFAVGSIGGALGLTALGTTPIKLNPTNAWAKVLEVKPFITEAGKDVVAGMFGADVFNAANRALTGLSFDDWVVNNTPIKNLPIDLDYKYMIGSTFNPGGWLSFGVMNLYGNHISNSINKGFNFFTDKLNKLMNKLSKNLMAKKRILNIKSKIGLRQFELREISNDALQTYNKKNNYWKGILESLNDILRIPNFRPSYIDFSKYITSPNKPYDLPYTIESTYSPYDVNTGKVTLPKFGTGEVSVFEIKPYEYKSAPITNLSTKNATNYPKIEEVNSPPDLRYVEALKHNIEYVKSKYPGSVAFGSSVGVTEGGLPHATHDIDLYITDVDLKALGKEDLPWVSEGLTKRDLLDGGRYDKYGEIDLNIIFTKEDNTIDFTKGRGLDLFRQLYPDLYQEAYLKANGDLYTMKTDVTAKLLLQKLDEKPILNTIMDAFESSKSKHKSRALWYLNHGDPDLVYEALLKHGESLAGKNMKHAPVTELNFLDYDENETLLRHMNIPGLLKPRDIAKDPKRMRNIFEYWWLNNTILSRGTSVENMPSRAAIDLGVPHEKDFGKYAIRNLTEWSGGTGGSVSGTGLNTVYWGDSGGGVAGNDIYGLILPILDNYTEGLTPEELINIVYQNFPKSYEPLTSPITVKDKYGNDHIIKNFNDLLQLADNITPEELSNVSELLGIRGIVGGWYGDSRYVGLTQKPKPGDIYFINPAFGRHAKYAHPTSASSRSLNSNRTNPYKDIINKLTRSDKHQRAYFENEQEYRPKHYNRYTLKDAVRRTVSKRLDDAYDEFSDKNRAIGRYDQKLTQRYNTIDRLANHVDKLRNRIKKRIALGVGLPSSIIGIPSIYLKLKLQNETELYLDEYKLNTDQIKLLEGKDILLKIRFLRRWERENKLKKK